MENINEKIIKGDTVEYIGTRELGVVKGVLCGIGLCNYAVEFNRGGTIVLSEQELIKRG